MASSKVSKYQVFDTLTISRKQLANAPYNPRVIDKGAKERLREGLRKHGLVQPIVWNKRTGNVVGGHQRLKQLDALEGTSDYELTVAVIDVDEREEVEINVQLNNPSMQGDWNMDMLADIATEYDFTFDDLGFSDTDIDLMFDGDERFSELFDTSTVGQVKGTLKDIKEDREQMRERLKGENGIDWYTVIVFADEEEKRDFHRRIHIPDYEQYVTVDQIERIAGDYQPSSQNTPDQKSSTPSPRP